jgi:hypothetical protein
MYHYTTARALQEERYKGRAVVRRHSPDESGARRSAPAPQRRRVWAAVTSFATRSHRATPTA